MSTTTHSFKVGDRVTFPPDALVKPGLIGVTFVVEEVPTGRRRNYRIRAESGGPRYSVRPEELVPASADAPSIGRPYVPIEFFDEGGIVTVSNGARKGIGAEEPFVVIRDAGRDMVNIAPLGGAGQPWRWPRAALVKRDLAWLTERLVEMA